MAQLNNLLARKKILWFFPFFLVFNTQAIAQSGSTQTRAEDLNTMTVEQLHERALQQLANEGYMPASNTFALALEKARKADGMESPLFKKIQRDLLKNKAKHLEEEIASTRERNYELSSSDLITFEVLAATYRLIDDFEMAENWYQEGIDMANKLLAEGYVLQEEYRHLEDGRFNQIKKTIVDLQFGYARVLAKMGNHKGALTYYADSKNGFTSKWESTPIMLTKHDYYVGVSLHSLNKYQEALTYFKRVLEVYENEKEFAYLHLDVLKDTERLAADSKSRLASN